MTYRVEVGPDVKQSTHHVALTDGKKWLGLIVCDSRGAADPFNISAAPNQRSSLRTKTGTTKYEDLEEPWSATAQDDWSGGRALEDYEEDTTRFFDSRRCQTAFNQIYCAPIDYYATGLKDSYTNWPGSVSWQTIYAGNELGYQFTLASAMQAGQLYILLRRRGTPRAGLTVSLCANDNGVPGNALATHTYTVSEITDVLSEWKKFTFDEITLEASTYYWITVSSTAGDYSSNAWQIGMKQTDSPKTSLYNNGSWTRLVKEDIYFRLCAADTGRKARFFTYKQLTFAVMQLPSGSPKLYINGDIGMADSNNGQLTKVIDATKSWQPDQWKGCRVGIIQGTGIAETGSVWRTIVGNDETSLTVDEEWTIAHDETTVYIITDTELFTEIPASTHGLTGYISDIIVTNDIIYFAQGDAIPVRKMKWRGGSWSSMADEYIHTVNGAVTTIQNCAMYLQTVRDTSGLILWRAQNNDDHSQISISMTAVTDWRDSQVTVADYTTAIDSNNGPREDPERG